MREEAWHPRAVTPAPPAAPAPLETPLAVPSRAFTVAAVLGLVAALPGIGYVVVSLLDTLANSSASVKLENALAWLAFAVFGPLPVVLSTVRMMRRPDRPIALFVVSLVLTTVPTLLFLGLAMFAPSTSGGIVLLCFLGLLAGFVAGVLAIGASVVAAVRRRRERELRVEG